MSIYIYVCSDRLKVFNNTVLRNCTKEGGWKQAESNENLIHLYSFAKSHSNDQSKVGIIGGAWSMHGGFWL
jgi:hypothetical protein